MFVTLKCLENLARLIVPQFDSLICRTGCKNLPIRVIGNVIHAPSVAFHSVCQLTLLIVPYLDRSILTCAGNIRVNWMHSDFGHP